MNKKFGVKKKTSRFFASQAHLDSHKKLFYITKWSVPSLLCRKSKKKKCEEFHLCVCQKNYLSKLIICLFFGGAAIKSRTAQGEKLIQLLIN